MSNGPDPMATMSFMMSMQAAAQADRTRRKLEDLTRTLCRKSYDSQTCDDLCLTEHREFIDAVSMWQAHYQVSYTNQCGGPVPPTHIEIGIRDGVWAGLGLGIALIFAVGLWRMLRD